MYIKTSQWSTAQKHGNRALSLRCPHCRQQGALEVSSGNKDIDVGPQEDKGRIVVGHRRCPDPKCRQHIFVVYNGGNGKLVTTYPPERLDFDATDLPERVREALEEAVACHAAEAYTATGLMVRKALELMCEEREAEGATLYDRIEALRDKVVLPQELMDGLHDLRLLGNDAAHVTSRIYNQVGKEEVEVAMDVAKEVLKSVYQLSGLISRLRTLQRQDSD